MLPMSGQSLSAIQEWQLLSTAIFDAAERQVDSTARPLRLWQYGGLAEMVAATAPGAVVGDSTLTKEQAIQRAALFQSLLTWLNTPVQTSTDADGTPITETPIALMSARRTTGGTS